MNTQEPSKRNKYPEISRHRLFRVLYESNEPLSTRQILIRCGVIGYKGMSSGAFYTCFYSTLYNWVRMGIIGKIGHHMLSRYFLTEKGKLKYTLISGG